MRIYTSPGAGKNYKYTLTATRKIKNVSWRWYKPWLPKTVEVVRFVAEGDVITGSDQLSMKATPEPTTVKL